MSTKGWGKTTLDTRGRPRVLESSLQSATEAELDRLQATGAILDYYHRPDGAPRRRGQERAGVPDLIIAVRDDLVLAIELKSATGRLTKWQRFWLQAFGTRGCVCRSIDEVRDFLGKWGVR